MLGVHHSFYILRYDYREIIDASWLHLEILNWCVMNRSMGMFLSSNDTPSGSSDRIVWRHIPHLVATSQTAGSMPPFAACALTISSQAESASRVVRENDRPPQWKLCPRTKPSKVQLPSVQGPADNVYCIPFIDISNSSIIPTANKGVLRRQSQASKCINVQYCGWSLATNIIV